MGQLLGRVGVTRQSHRLGRGGLEDAVSQLDRAGPPERVRVERGFQQRRELIRNARVGLRPVAGAAAPGGVRPP